MVRRLAALLAVSIALACTVGCAGGGSTADSEESLGPKPYAGSLLVIPSPLHFARTGPGCLRTQTLQLENLDPERALEVTAVSLPNDALVLDASLPLTLEPAQSRFVDLRFAPAQAGNWSGSLAFETDEGEDLPYQVAATAVSEATATPDVAAGPPAARDPLDLVFVLDVSTTMDELARMRRAIQGLFDLIESDDLDVRLGLTTFENGVVVHAGGAFLERRDFFRELDGQLVGGVWVPDPEHARQLLNYDLPENVLDALHRSATDFRFRPAARRTLLLMTDATFIEPPRVFSDGNRPHFSFAEVSEQLASRDIQLVSVHAAASGRGLSTEYAGLPSLVDHTGGRWFELADVGSGALSLDTLLADLAVAGSACR